MEKTANLAAQLNAYENGLIIDREGNNTECYNFYDWFCRDSSLQRKSWTLMKQVKKFVANTQVDLLDTYVFFKNNCTGGGKLYDDFRICDANGVLFTVFPKCGHSGKAEIWGRNATGRFECLKQAETFSKLFS